MSTVKERLSAALAEVAQIEVSSRIQWSVPKREGQGDLSCNLAMMLAKERKTAPRNLAVEWSEKVNWADFGVEKVEVAGPGFLNFWLGNKYFQDVVRDIFQQDKKYGQSNLGNGQKVLIEFVSANPTGPMNIVSARAAAIGDSLVRVMRKAGFEVDAEFYVNDAGRQILRLGNSVIARIKGEDVPEDGYHGDYVIELANKLKEKTDLDLNNAEEIGVNAANINLSSHKSVLENYGVSFNRWFRESELHSEEAPQKTLELLRAKDAVFDKDDATWFAGTKFGDVEDRVIVTSEGRPTYLLPDIAYHLNKASRGYDIGIDLLGPDHLDYVGRMKAALKALGHEDFLEVLIVQQVHLISAGEKMKMSKRAGKMVTLQELVDEVGKDVARYFFLQRKTSSPLEFDLDLAKEQSDRNPVFYVQYAHTRISGILRQKGCPEASLDNIHLLIEDEEIGLIKHLEQFTTYIERAAETREPQKLVNYLHDLATIFHKFYTAHRVLVDDVKLASARAALIKAAKIILAEGLNLLGVSAPERM